MHTLHLCTSRGYQYSPVHTLIRDGRIWS